jgi:hypothetical protein
MLKSLLPVKLSCAVLFIESELNDFITLMSLLHLNLKRNKYFYDRIKMNLIIEISKIMT